ncbi:HAD-superfamily hydrolase, subfamily IA, variant 1 [Neorickettsia risticii str. Illinois]|uniref:phosphoglycolate phosphatase n=1 Tax=Neorickettsia risticii (strain Illinois) TaxID=434131 RepID=C6V642_NEORI|nr:HAD-IA family hydrolase [Neorickettsia risticii]ACT69849.1 HAD-superfamily hydrolase, subfamily IA, variant 1 [Neorickettsia risticii str. Illinois]
MNEKLNTKTKVTPEAILFDWDDTIVDTRVMILNAVNKTLSHFGKPVLDRDMNAPERMDFFKQTFGEEWIFAYSLFTDHLRSENPEPLRIFPGFTSFLDLITEKRIFTGIVSNKYNELLKKEVDSLGLTDRFDVIVGSGDTDQDKPSAKPLLYALSIGNITPSRETVLFIGNSATDMECARNATVRGIAYRATPIEGFENIPIIRHYNQAKMLIF